ncbi:hypothetical protein ASZ78_016888 [Callipepla squamata]|uniref:Cytosolic fatty-acid binding proteins domain-containing protein n=1 Tax=Callipepla squamata TaxID=9009 RepID=A0A226MV95_CALSU|nr:hypothetical protein ASZ78_016888 [Callipepla squamata]
MSFTGKYELQSQENFEPFMKALGLPDDQIQKGKDIKSISEIVQNGNKFKITVTTGSKVITIPGQYFPKIHEMSRWHHWQILNLSSTLGEADTAGIFESRRNDHESNANCVVNMEGNNKLVANLKGLKSVTELNGDTITHVSGEEKDNG